MQTWHQQHTFINMQNTLESDVSALLSKHLFSSPALIRPVPVSNEINDKSSGRFSGLWIVSTAHHVM